MDSTPTFLIVSALAVMAGGAIALFTGRWPARGWVGVILLLIAASGMLLIQVGGGNRANLPMAVVFWLCAPVAVVYSIRARKHAPDRAIAKGAFVGALFIGVFFLFWLAGLLYWSFLTLIGKN